jgi:hypothetical protein
LSSLIPKKSFSALNKNPLNKGFFVGQRKGKFDIGVISQGWGKAWYFSIIPMMVRIKKKIFP